MCGRSRMAMSAAKVEQLTGVPKERWVDRDKYQPTYNAAPGAWTPILRLDNNTNDSNDDKDGGQHAQQPILQTMRWGLVPSFTKPGQQLDFFKMFNARSESVAEKPVFSRLLARQRCVVLGDGFYEWGVDAGGKKQPYFIHMGEGKPLRMAGLYDVYSGGEEGPLATYTILTVDSCKKLQWLHNRMPVLLEDDAAVDAWLKGGTPQGSAAAAATTPTQTTPTKTKQAAAAPLWMCVPCNSDALSWHPVTAAMSKLDYNKPDASADVRKKKSAITSFFQPVASPAKASAKPSSASAAAAAQHKDTATTNKLAAAKQEQQPKQEAPGAVRNSDQQEGPSAAEEAVAAGAAAGGEHAGGKRQRHDDGAAAAQAPAGALAHDDAGVEAAAAVEGRTPAGKKPRTAA